MSAEISHNPKYPVCEHAQRMHDVLLVSSFALWLAGGCYLEVSFATGLPRSASNRRMDS